MTLQSPFKSAVFSSGRRQFGLWLALADPYVAEICATAGFDWLLIDAEHGPNDLRLLLGQLQALAAYDSAVLVRLRDHDPAGIKQALDIGVCNLVIPMVQSPAQAQALAAAVAYPPEGFRGVASSMTRASLWNSVPDYARNARTGICLVAQVECRLGVENVAAISATPGIDAVFIGPADLAASLGHLGQPGHPDVQAAIAHCATEIARSGKPAGIFATNPSDVDRYAALGFSFLSVGTDIGLLANGTRSLAEDYKLPGVA